MRTRLFQKFALIGLTIASGAIALAQAEPPVRMPVNIRCEYPSKHGACNADVLMFAENAPPPAEARIVVSCDKNELYRGTFNASGVNPETQMWAIVPNQDVETPFRGLLLADPGDAEYPVDVASTLVVRAHDTDYPLDGKCNINRIVP